MSNTEVVKELDETQEVMGLIQARRIINKAAGFYFGGQLTPFSEELKELALTAIGAVERRVDDMNDIIHATALLMSSRMEGKTIEESYVAGYRLLFNYMYPADAPREHVDDCELLSTRDLDDIKQILMGEPSLVGARYNELKEKLDLTTDYARKFQKFTKLEIK